MEEKQEDEVYRKNKDEEKDLEKEEQEEDAQRKGKKEENEKIEEYRHSSMIRKSI